MESSVLLASTLLFYLLGMGLQGFRFTGRLQRERWLVLVAGLMAATAHAWLLHRWIDVQGGQNLSFFNVLSLVAWLNALLIILASLGKPLLNLVLFANPLAVLSLGLVMLFPTSNIIDTGADPKQLSHILLAVLAFSVLCITAWQALVIAWQNRMLRHKKAANLLRLLPSLQTMESLLFQMVILGFVLLTIVLGSSILFFQNIFAQHLLQKTVLSLLAWGVFATLLLGRFYFGWRGDVAVRWTLSGFLLLALSYFGSRFLAGLLV